MIQARQPMPPFSRFTVEQRLADQLVELIEKKHPRHVLELGSGLSTVHIGYALERHGQGHCTSLEHDEMYHERTTEWVDFHKLNTWCDVIHAPIKNVEIEGMAYPWYDTAKIPPHILFDFVFVDGPPGQLGTLARWPAYPVLRRRLRHDAWIVCDDTSRDHERLMVVDWLKRADGLIEQVDIPTERGAVLLKPKERSYASTG